MLAHRFFLQLLHSLAILVFLLLLHFIFILFLFDSYYFNHPHYAIILFYPIFTFNFFRFSLNSINLLILYFHLLPFIFSSIFFLLFLFIKLFRQFFIQSTLTFTFYSPFSLNLDLIFVFLIVLLNCLN